MKLLYRLNPPPRRRIFLRQGRALLLGPNTITALLTCALLPAAAQGFAETLHIAVASNFKPTLEIINKGFTRISPAKITLTSSSSGQIFAQIKKGAPYDLFFSADADKPKTLEKQGWVLEGHRKSYAIGQLALWISPSLAHQLPSPVNQLSDAQQLRTALKQLLNHNAAKTHLRISLANPTIAPYGAAAQATLKHLALWNPNNKNIIRANNVSQVMQYIQSGNIQIGFVALSQLQLAQIDPTHYTLIPPHLYPSLDQQVVVLRNSKNPKLAVQYYQWLDKQSVGAQIQQAGYSAPSNSR